MCVPGFDARGVQPRVETLQVRIGMRTQICLSAAILMMVVVVVSCPVMALRDGHNYPSTFEKDYCYEELELSPDFDNRDFGVCRGCYWW